MAAPNSKKPCLATAAVAAPLAILALLIAGTVLPAADASTLTLYQFPGCAGQTQQMFFCNVCQDFTLNAGYKFDYLFGQAALLYDMPGCAGLPSKVLTQSTSQCTAVSRKSVMISCN